MNENVMDKVLEILSDGKEHSPTEIYDKVNASEQNIDLVLDFLFEHDIVELVRQKHGTLTYKLPERVQRFYTELNKIGG